jgi:DNA mismatch repair protein MutL
MEVRHLFFNTPVRRKFLKTAATELGHIVEAFTRIALAYPEIHFTLSHNGKTLHELPPTSVWAERIGHFFGDEIRQNLIAVDSQHEDIQLSGFAVAPVVSRSHNRLQYLFLNGRFIRDRSLQHALTEAYRGLLMTGRFPVVFLRLQMPPDQVDVNVHPAKLEVRFQESGKLYSQLLGTLRSRFLSADLAEKVRSASETWHRQVAGAAEPNQSSWADGSRELSCDPELVQQKAAAVGQWARGGGDRQQQTLPVTVARSSGGNWTADGEMARPAGPSTRGGVDRGALRDLPEFRKFPSVDPLWPPPEVAGRPGSAAGGAGLTVDPALRLVPGMAAGTDLAEPDLADKGLADSVPARGELMDAEPAGADLVGAGVEGITGRSGGHAPIPTAHVQASPRIQVLQIQQRYLVCEADEGLVIIDQHALHERILYEQIKHKFLAGNLETQRLLVPQPVDLAPAEAAAVLEVQDELMGIGLGIESFGGSTILVTSYPAVLQSRNLAELIRIVVDQLAQGKQRPDPQDLLDHLMATMACKAAVKAGDRLSQEEMLALIEHRDLCRDAHHCPHGRPSWLVFSQEELDKKFKRI